MISNTETIQLYKGINTIHENVFIIIELWQERNKFYSQIFLLIKKYGSETWRKFFRDDLTGDSFYIEVISFEFAEGILKLLLKNENNLKDTEVINIKLKKIKNVENIPFNVCNWVKRKSKTELLKENILNLLHTSMYSAK